MFKKLLLLLPIFIVVLALYYPVLTTYFSQDDFFHFKISQTDGSLNGFLNLFGFHSFEDRGIAFYRPIFREVLYNIFYSLFGLNHIPFRILSLLIHSMNIFLVYTLIQKIFQKKYLSLFVAFFFGISSANVATLYYLAGGIQASGATMFILLTLIFFIKYLENKCIRYLIFSFLTFLLGLGSHELASTTPLLLLGLIFLYAQPKKILPKILQLWLFFLILGIYLYLNIERIGFSSDEKQYQLIFNLIPALNSIAWYYGWALGLPEMLIDFVLPGFKLNPTLLRYWGGFYIIIFSTFATSIAILVLAVVYLLLKKRAVFKNKKFWFLLIWFPITVSPVIFLPSHKSTYYLAPSLAAFWASLGFIIFQAFWNLKRKLFRISVGLLGIFFISVLLLSATSAKLGSNTYWAATRGKLAEKLINQTKSKYPMLPKSSVIYFLNDPNYPFLTKEWGGTSKQASIILNGSDALQLLYKDPSLRVFYEDLGGIPPTFIQKAVYQIVAKIN